MLPEINVFHAQFFYLISGDVMIIMTPTMFAVGTVTHFTYFLSLTVTLKVKVVLSSFYR